MRLYKRKYRILEYGTEKKNMNLILLVLFTNSKRLLGFAE